MLVLENKPKSIAAEAYRTLRTNIQYSSFDKEIRSIVFTSSEPGEGKTTTAANFALALAQDGKKVILIDCDLRKPSVHKNFRVSNNNGVSDVLVGKAEITKTIYNHESGLHILTSGKIPPNPSEMLGSKLMGKLLEELKENYEYVVIDAPPVLAVTDAQLLSTKVDGTVLVVRAQGAKKENVISAKNALDKVRANIVGTVLNGVENKRNKYYYYYGEGK